MKSQLKHTAGRWKEIIKDQNRDKSNREEKISHLLLSKSKTMEGNYKLQDKNVEVSV